MFKRTTLNLKPILLTALVCGVSACSQDEDINKDKTSPITKTSTKPEAMSAPQEIEASAKVSKLDDSQQEIIAANVPAPKIERQIAAQEKVSKPKLQKPNKVVKKKTIKIEKADKVSTIMSAVNKTEVDLKSKESKIVKAITQTLDVSYETDMQENDNKQRADSTIWYFFRYKFSSEYTGRFWANIGKNLHESYETTLKDTKLTLSKKGIQLTENLKLSPSATLVLPTSEKSKRNEELNFGVEVNPSLSYKILDELRLSYLPRGVKNFHEYKTSRTNSLNTEYKLIQFVVLNYAFVPRWYFEPTLIYSNTWSYEGTRRDPSFMSVLEVGHDYNKNLVLAAGLTTSGSVYKAEEGLDSNIEVYDAESASIYGKFALTF